MLHSLICCNEANYVLLSRYFQPDLTLEARRTYEAQLAQICKQVPNLWGDTAEKTRTRRRVNWSCVSRSSWWFGSGRDHDGAAGGADDSIGQETHRGRPAGQLRQGGRGTGRDGAAGSPGERGRGQHRPDDQAQAVPIEVDKPCKI
ncbi:hypothetical protein GQ600_693 [Phytophthora cactorum]|nr:hypothetical protein GQ600_693 [Phytophthora cactorum]